MKRLIAAIVALSVMSCACVMTACSGQNEQNNETSRKPLESQTVSKVSQASKEKPPEVSLDDSKPKITDSQLADINKKIAAHQNVPEFTCKSETINAREISADKLIRFIPENSSNSYIESLTRNFKNASGSAGFKNVAISETDGSSSSLNDGLSAAVTEKNDLAILAGDINKDLISGSIETTQANGIEVFSVGSKGVSKPDHYVDYTVPVNYELIGELMADWGIVKTNGKINALAVNVTDSTLSGTVFEGFKREFETYVSSSSGYCTTLNVTAIEVGNGLASKIKRAVNDDSNINYVFVFDDSAIADAETAADQLSGKVKVVSTGGGKEAFDAAESGRIEMLVAQSYEWTAYATVDYVLRVLGGKELPKEQDVPVRIVDKDSIAKAKKDYSGPSYDNFDEICFGSAFVTGYTNLWRL